MTHHKGDTLDHGLQRKQNTGCRLGARPQRTHKIGIRHVIDIGDEHGYGSGDAQL